MELTLGLLTLFAQEVNAYYVANGYFLAKVYVPRQKIKNVVVKITVDEGKLEAVNVVGENRFSSDDLLKRFSKIKDEPVPREQTLEEVLLRINDYVGLEVKSVLKPGKEPRSSDLFLEV